MEHKELFEDYELGGWEISPKIYKIVGASLVVHLFAFFIIGQFNLLQAKACDGPYIGKVCQVLDAAYLSSTFLGQDPDFIDKDYIKTQIDEADVTYIDVTRTEPPLEYPAGYFAMTNPESQMNQTPIMNDMGEFTLPSQTSPSQLDFGAPQVLPTPNNNVANQQLPDSPFDFGDDMTAYKPSKPVRVPSRKPLPTRSNSIRNNSTVAGRSKLKNDSPASLPNLNGETAKSSDGNANSNQTAAGNNTNAQNGVKPETEEDKTKFNQRALKEFGTKYGEQILTKKIDINAPFKIEVIGKLDENGKITNAKMVAADGSDPKMSEVAKEAIAAFSDSNLLRPLYDAGGRDVKITFVQDQSNLQAIIQTQAKNEKDAKALYNFVNVAKLIVQNSRRGSDEANLMEKALLATQGKTFIINFSIPNDEKNQMIEKSLKNLKQELEQKKNQPNSVAVSTDTKVKS